MPLTQFQHCLVLAEDLEETKNFYVDILGLRVGDRPPFEFDGYWLYVGDTPCIHLAKQDMGAGGEDYLERKSGRQAKDCGPLDHIAFVATGIDKFVDVLEKNNIAMRHRTVPNLKLHQIFVKDPNGVTIELNYDYEESKKFEEAQA
ncbi:MAG: VOC family protein [Rhodospirillales bacterium]|nr:VOC family protein [Rhodospirillales bacterium]